MHKGVKDSLLTLTQCSAQHFTSEYGTAIVRTALNAKRGEAAREKTKKRKETRKKEKRRSPTERAREIEHADGTRWKSNNYEAGEQKQDRWDRRPGVEERARTSQKLSSMSRLGYLKKPERA